MNQLLSMDLINHILSFRPTHPVAVLIKDLKRNLNSCHNLNFSYVYFSELRKSILKYKRDKMLIDLYLNSTSNPCITYDNDYEGY